MHDVVGRWAFLRILSAVLVRTKGWARSFQPSMKARILALRARTDPKVPRWMAWRSMIPSQTSTRFIHEAEVGVWWTTARGFASSQRRTSMRLCAA